MDKNGKRVVAFSFFNEKEDLFDIIDNVQLKDWEQQMQYWEKSGCKGNPPHKTKKKSLTNFFKRPKTETDSYWRPSTALAISLINEGITIDEYNLLYQPNLRGHERAQTEGANYIKETTEVLAEGTTVNLAAIDIGAGHDFESIYCALYDYFQKYLEEHRAELNSANRPRYIVNVSSGSQATRMCLFLLAQNRWIPAECVQLWTEDPKDKNRIGKCAITNPVLSSAEYKKLADRRKKNAETNQSTLKQQIKTQDENYNKIIEDIEKIATITNEPILLLGDTGVGKSEIARQIFELRKKQHKTKQEGKFQHFNCSGFKGDLVDSTLFGHVAGAFTDATKDKTGIIELANGGVLFLDEIGNLPLETQGKLLTVLDTHKFFKLGNHTEEIESNFFLICATNEDLVKRVNENTFRRDLFERIRTWAFNIPNLAKRKDDIPPNISEELKRFEKEYERHVTLEGQPLDKFLGYVRAIPLYGNFRELRRMIWHMATFADDGVIDMDLVEKEIERHQHENSLRPHCDDTPSDTDMATEPHKNSSDDYADKLLPQLFGDDYANKFDPLFLCQLRYVISVCCQQLTKNAADVGRIISPARLRQSKNGGNANNILANFFRRKEIREYKLSFAKIRELANLARATKPR